ncbi:hypothetical protein M1403_02250 [Patescibacteria group bacterium]|nr:hypothetical protein [Patescibacteria group bacterium]
MATKTQKIVKGKETNVNVWLGLIFFISIVYKIIESNPSGAISVVAIGISVIWNLVSSPIIVLAIIASIFFGNWQNWFKTDIEKEYDKEQMGWLLSKIGDILNWIFLLYGIQIAFMIIKTLWRLA